MLLSACTIPEANITTSATQSTIPTTTITQPITTTPPETTVPPTTVPEVEIPLQNFTYKDFTDKKSLLNEWDAVENYIVDLFLFIAKLDFYHPNYTEISNTVTAEIEAMQQLSQQYAWAYRALEYPVATEVWLYMINEMGYSKIVAAGIMGNMMAECGGLTLKLDWTATNPKSGCYGLCQWHPKYHTEVQGADLQGQLEYMKKSFPKSMSQQWALNGYKEGFTYEEFLALQDIEEAAKAFCLIYERPGGYNPKRGDYALQAFRYFTTPVAPIDIAQER